MGSNSLLPHTANWYLLHMFHKSQLLIPQFKVTKARNIKNLKEFPLQPRTPTLNVIRDLASMKWPTKICWSKSARITNLRSRQSTHKVFYKKSVRLIRVTSLSKRLNSHLHKEPVKFFVKFWLDLIHSTHKTANNQSKNLLGHPSRFLWFQIVPHREIRHQR